MFCSSIAIPTLQTKLRSQIAQGNCVEMMVCRQIQNYGRGGASIYWESYLIFALQYFASLANVAVWSIWSACFWKSLSPCQSEKQFLVYIPNNHVLTVFLLVYVQPRLAL